MKRQNYLKSMLCLLLGLVCHVAWAQTESPTIATGYYHLSSKATDRHEHLYNNALLSGNGNRVTLQSDTKVTTNGGIWHITSLGGGKVGIKNGDGNPIVAGGSGGSLMGSYDELTIGSVTDDGWYFFEEALNCSKSGAEYSVGGINHLTLWASGGSGANDNLWCVEPVSTEGKTIYEVVVEGDADGYAIYNDGTTVQNAFDGGFFITDKAITTAQLSTGILNNEIKEENITIEGTTIKVSIKPLIVKQDLYNTSKGDGVIPPYRIPGITTAYNGRLITAAARLVCGTDPGYGEVDVVCRTSDDNGDTWSDMILVADGTGEESATKNIFETAFGDPAIVADRTSSEVLVIAVAGCTVYGNGKTTRQNPNMIATIHSTDNGETWGEPVNVTEQIYSLFDEGNVIQAAFVGGGKVFQSRIVKKDKYYRLYAAMCARPNGNRVIYSDDFGRTWHALGGASALPAPGGDEPKCEELPDGRVILSSRVGGGRIYNIYTYSNTLTAEGAWGTDVKSTFEGSGHTPGGNSTNGEMLIVPVVRNSDQKEMFLALQSLPTGSGRTHVGIYYKELTDVTDINSVTALATDWNGFFLVTDKSSAYSSMDLQADDRIGFIYEETLTSFGKRDNPVSTCFPNGEGQHNFDGFDNIYVAYPLEYITNGAYSIKRDVDRRAYLHSYFTALTTDASDKVKANVSTALEALSAEPTTAEVDNLYFLMNEEEDLAYILTDEAGNTYEGSFRGFAGTSVPSFTGVAGYTLTNQAWDGTTLTATITFPFPVSKEGGVTNATFMANWIKSGVDPKKWQAVLEDGIYNVKVWKPENTPVYTELDTWRWAIYPQFADGAFTFLIKNIEADKYVYVNPTLESPSGSKGYVTLQTEGTKFSVVANGNYINLAYAKNNGTILKLTTNSENDHGVYLGSYSGTHAGNHISCPALTYPLTDEDGFVNGGIYTFVSSKGWMGATESCDNVISTAKASHNVTGTTDNAMFLWTVYKSNNGNYYLYNLGKQMFMGVQSNNNSSVPFAEIPQGKKLTFKKSGSTDYPFMFSTDNAGVVNHNGSFGDGLINWTGGWNNLNDAGSNHKVNALVGTLTADELKSIADLVEAYDKRFYAKTEVDNANTPNTHFGSVRAANASGETLTKLKKGMGVVAVDYDGTQTTTIDFTREYRGYEFQGFYLGDEELGKSFALTEERKALITEENPLVAKFTATDEVTLFYDDDEFSYRIPAIGKTSTGRLIAVSDYRHCLDDIGMNRWGKGYRVDLVIRTSDDNGKTWSPIKTIAEGIDNSTADDCAYGDAAIAVVGQEIVVMAVAGSTQYGKGSAEKTSRLARIYSSDNGETWVKEDITEKVYGYEGALYPNVYTAFFGSGRLAVDPDFNESGKARIYGSMLTQGMGNIVIYSDDMGLTWNKLGGQVANANEPKIEILPSGQILFSARRGGGRNFNVFTYTNKETSEGTWSSAVNGCDNGGSNGTNGEILLIDAKNAMGEDVKLLLQSQPVGGSNEWDRRDVTIWYKEITDKAYTSTEIASGWSKGLQVSNQLSAYSAMTLQTDGKVAFFFEEAPCYADRNDWGYCMVYIPLTIEDITKNNYFSLDADLTTERSFNVVLTDAQGNEYHDQVESSFGEIATTLTTNHPFITLGDNASIEFDGSAYTYTNTVTLPFKVSNEETTVWHNIYWPSNTGSGYPVYLSASSASDTYVPKVTESAVYGNSSYNTAGYADKISWAVYNVDNGFTFKFKNKLTGKFIQATGIADGDAQNVKYVDEANATAFELDHNKGGVTRLGDYALKASINSTVGYLSSTSATGYHYATHYKSSGHNGAWLKFVEAPDFEGLIAEVNGVLNMFGDGLGQYTGASVETVEAAKTAMENSNTVKLNELNTYAALMDDATLNMPQAGQFFRVAYDYGGNVGKLYMQSVTSSVKGVQFSAETGNTSIWLYYNGALYSYAAGQCLRETGDYRGLQAVGGKTNATFRASTRARGKYTIACTSYVHANSSGSNYFTDHCSSDNCAAHDLILEEVTSLPFTIAAVGYGTLYAPVALRIPEGIKAYTGTLSEGNTLLELTKVTSGVIPANTGVVLYRDPEGVAASSSATTHNFEIVADSETELASCFAGDVATIANSGTPYTLQMHDFDGDGTKEGIAFKRYTGANLTGFKAYLNMPSSNAAALRIRFVGEATGIETTANSGQTTAIYDLMGRRVETMPKGGIYIVNGKKIIF